ncbi:hypothetical protein GYMLUDRAFT_85937 [Collybiopsis luxurians FD-317 M1]|uniref:Probable RNA polymerase II nuclear localization protein SLC7A6OS n=1 Tax=Collybiopsis luxurians FD-317 M1 TaxID=944289 RepID=A0A0D0CTY0_9AGAR|nr:hypothetical protein GYMLUDRAFT_85937 [Collybiopsis luxurians FD-317 M1]
MATPAISPEQPYTFLRIKRKRNEEPLDALVVESGARRKKSRGGTGVFQFARTVEEGAWEDEEQQKAIQHQLSILAQQPTSAEGKNAAAPPPSSPATHSPSKATEGRRYTIIERSLPVNHSPLRKPTNPPQILSSKELAAQRNNSDFKMYDAVLENSSAQDQIDPALEKLLQDYLKLEAPSIPAASTEDADYVWDIFYHKPGTYTQALMDAVAVGTVTGLPPQRSGDSDSDSYSEEEDEADEDSNAEEWYTNDYPDEEESDWSENEDEGKFGLASANYGCTEY